ncbi:MAG: hypothetical protein IT276_03490 [Ignavibacteriaceae bacterium]|nr:hypothetical protein [Ignavibacterium sp.]MCC6253948.1 hypothetical protein [Ignavibacteriaceae bacterium]HMN25602.1 hypothetical protein [Ignavibacteriaceae bacterium]HRN25295.1 hypothetical protein [Ignavibacteriaceae bacterium]HRP93894.1 hypothetical protein [Ignavibacteriaceae bacterium]
MKKIIFVIVIILFSTALLYPQKMRNRMMQNKGKLEQLEKVKLIEALDLKEDVAVRFFARRNESRNEIETLENKVDDILVELENTFNSKDKNIETKQKQLVSEFYKTKETVDQKRLQFIKSLDDILTTEQICKLIVFEKKFIEEIRNVLLDKKRH